MIYSLALGGVIHNLDEEKDADLIQKCLQIDDECIDNGMTHYAFAIAQKMGSWKTNWLNSFDNWNHSNRYSTPPGRWMYKVFIDRLRWSLK